MSLSLFCTVPGVRLDQLAEALGLPVLRLLAFPLEPLPPPVILYTSPVCCGRQLPCCRLSGDKQAWSVAIRCPKHGERMPAHVVSCKLPVAIVFTPVCPPP